MLDSRPLHVPSTNRTSTLIFVLVCFPITTINVGVDYTTLVHLVSTRMPSTFVCTEDCIQRTGIITHELHILKERQVHTTSYVTTFRPCVPGG